ncbi:hypothetical protein F4779DRAFT_590419 [Xylariaceae sp. FL0662B]|nr:hypothetical protein F4779DRAFT_590419 [Xylariaceae sp. FL0662B]
MLLVAIFYSMTLGCTSMQDRIWSHWCLTNSLRVNRSLTETPCLYVHRLLNGLQPTVDCLRIWLRLRASVGKRLGEKLIIGI